MPEYRAIIGEENKVAQIELATMEQQRALNVALDNEASNFLHDWTTTTVFHCQMRDNFVK